MRQELWSCHPTHAGQFGPSPLVSVQPSPLQPLCRGSLAWQGPLLSPREVGNPLSSECGGTQALHGPAREGDCLCTTTRFGSMSRHFSAAPNIPIPAPSSLPLPAPPCPGLCSYPATLPHLRHPPAKPPDYSGHCSSAPLAVLGPTLPPQGLAEADRGEMAMASPPLLCNMTQSPSCPAQLQGHELCLKASTAGHCAPSGRFCLEQHGCSCPGVAMDHSREETSSQLTLGGPSQTALLQCLSSRSGVCEGSCQQP